MLRIRNKAVLTTPAAMAATATVIVFDTEELKTNNNCELVNNAVEFNHKGLYDTVCSITVSNSATSAVTVKLSLYANGSAKAGVFESVTVPASGSATIVLPYTVDVINASSGNAFITYVLEGGAVSLNNAYAEIHKLS